MIYCYAARLIPRRHVKDCAQAHGATYKGKKKDLFDASRGRPPYKVEDQCDTSTGRG